MNTLPNKLGNPEASQNHQLKSSATNPRIVGEDLLREFYKLLHLRFYVSSDQCKNKEFETHFYKEIIVPIIPTNLEVFSYKICFYPFFVLSKNESNFFSKLIVW